MVCNIFKYYACYTYWCNLAFSRKQLTLNKLSNTCGKFKTFSFHNQIIQQNDLVVEALWKSEFFINTDLQVTSFNLFANVDNIDNIYQFCATKFELQH